MKTRVQVMNDEEERKLLYRWRRQLVSLTDDLKTTANRRDWLLHMTQQAPTLAELISVVDEFNQLQVNRADTPHFSLIEVIPHELGAFLGNRDMLRH